MFKRRQRRLGRPQVGMRRLQDEAAEELGIDPSLLSPGDDPDGHRQAEGSAGGGPDGQRHPDGLAAEQPPHKDLYKGMVRRLIRRSRERPDNSE